MALFVDSIADLLFIEEIVHAGRRLNPFVDRFRDLGRRRLTLGAEASRQ